MCGVKQPRAWNDRSPVLISTQGLHRERLNKFAQFSALFASQCHQFDKWLLLHCMHEGTKVIRHLIRSSRLMSMVDQTQSLVANEIVSEESLQYGHYLLTSATGWSTYCHSSLPGWAGGVPGGTAGSGSGSGSGVFDFLVPDLFRFGDFVPELAEKKFLKKVTTASLKICQDRMTEDQELKTNHRDIGQE